MANDIGMSVTEIAQIGDMLRDVTRNVELLTNKIVWGMEYISSEQIKFDKENDQVMKKVEERWYRLDRKIAAIYDKQINKAAEWSDKYVKRLDEIERRWHKIDRAAQKATQFHLSHGSGGLLSKTGGAMGMSGSRGLFSGVMGQIQQMSNLLPMGGLLGLALFGAMKQTEWAAAAHSAGRNFAQVGSGAKAASKEILSLSTSLGPRFGMDPSALAQELGAVSSAFASFGVSGPQAAEAVEDMGDSALVTSFRLDTLFKAGTGTFAQAIGQAFESTGDTIQATTRSVRDLALTLRDTGVNVVQTIGQLMQLTMGMRVQRQGVDDLSKQYFTLSKALAAGPMAGANASALGRATMAGLQGVAAGISGASEGIMAVLGERISRRTGGKQSGIDAMIGWQEGMLGKGGPGNMMGEVVREMGAFAKEITGGGSRNEQIFALMKTNPALGFEGSRAIVEMNEQIAKGVPVEKATAEAQKALQKAFIDRAKETSDFQKKMMELTMALAKIGGATLNLLVHSFSELPSILLAVYRLTTGTGAEKSAATQYLLQIGREQNRILPDLQEGLEDVAKVFIGLGETAVRVGTHTTKEERERKNNYRRIMGGGSVESSATPIVKGAAVILGGSVGDDVVTKLTASFTDKAREFLVAENERRGLSSSPVVFGQQPHVFGAPTQSSADVGGQRVVVETTVVGVFPLGTGSVGDGRGKQ